MSETLDELLRDTLRAEWEPTQALNQRILGAWVKEKKHMKQQNKKAKIAAAAVTACLLSVGGVSVYAAYRYLTPAQVAGKLHGNDALQTIFQEEDATAINLTQQSNGYDITLLGLASGKEISPYVSADNAAEINQKRTYAVVAVTHSDQTPMKEKSACVSPLINGVDWMLANNATMNVSTSCFVEDGILYCLMECDNLEIFAGRGVQLGVVDAFGTEGSAFEMDAETGNYRRVESYAGTNALFDLPLDPAKADETAAEAYLAALEEAQAETTATVSHGSEELDAFYAALTTTESDAAFLKQHASLLDTQTLTIDADGNISYANADGGNGSHNTSTWQIGEKMILSTGDKGTLESVIMDVFTLNADGTVTYERYVPLSD